MKKVWFFTVFFMVGCKNGLLPVLPDVDQTINDVDTCIFNDLNNEVDDDHENDTDIYENSDEDDVPDIDIDNISLQKVTSLLVATVKGYDVPESGKVYEFDSATLEMLSESSDNLLFGSETGSDIALTAFDSTYAVFTRHNGKSVYFPDSLFEGEITFDIFTEPSDEYFNFQDMVYNYVKEEYVISAQNLDELVILRNGAFKRQKFTQGTEVFPARMRAIDGKIYVNLQYLNDQRISEKGVMAVVNMSDYSAQFIDLGVRNPVGKIEYNPDFDKNHLYTTCSGSWAKRDGAVVRVNLDTHKVETVLRESDEEGSLMNVDLVDISITDEGSFYLVVSDNNSNWINKLYEFDTKEEKIFEVDSGVNAFAANPIVYSSDNDSVFYFCDKEEKTFVKKRNVKTGKVDSYELDAGPASIEIWNRFK